MTELYRFCDSVNIRTVYCNSKFFFVKNHFAKPLCSVQGTVQKFLDNLTYRTFWFTCNILFSVVGKDLEGCVIEKQSS